MRHNKREDLLTFVLADKGDSVLIFKWTILVINPDCCLTDDIKGNSESETTVKACITLVQDCLFYTVNCTLIQGFHAVAIHLKACTDYGKWPWDQHTRYEYKTIC